MNEAMNEDYLLRNLIILLVLVGFGTWIGWQAHAMFFKRHSTSRFCEIEEKILTERELIDRFLFSKDYGLLTLNQKKELMNERGVEYPECCFIGNLETSWVIDANKLTSEQEPPHYTIQSYYPPGKSGSKYLHYSTYVDSCGRKISHFGGSYYYVEDITKEIFYSKKAKLKKYWQSYKE